jgi:hypothetical protein
MASLELRALWALHGLDQMILDLKNQAAHLDVGQLEAAKIKAIESKNSTEHAAAHHLISEQVELELQQKSFDEKAKKFEKQLFGGTIVNPREVEAMEKEIAMLKRNRNQLDDRLLELMDQAPAAKVQIDAMNKELDEARKSLAEKRQSAVERKGKIEAAYKEAVVKRAEKAKAISAGLLAKYEAIRKRCNGVGMAEVVKGRSCGGCGTVLPERTLVAALGEGVVVCEACHRILYYTTGAI